MHKLTRPLFVLIALTILGLFAGSVLAPSAALARSPQDQRAPPPDDKDDDASTYDPKLSYVLLECSNGDVVLEVHPGWAPIGAAHFLKLVDEGYYDGAPWFRVIDGFMAQCGFSGDESLTAEWQDQTIKDDAVMQGNRRGYVSYGMSGQPNSRSTHFFINYGDNFYLDGSGFAAFAVVVDGMAVADKFFKTGENPPDGQAKLGAPGGLAWFGRQYPEASYIIRATVLDEYQPGDDDDDDDEVYLVVGLEDDDDDDDSVSDADDDDDDDTVGSDDDDDDDDEDDEDDEDGEDDED